MQTTAIEFPQTLMTSVALASTEQHTVAFVGTNEGIIKKVCDYTTAYLLTGYIDLITKLSWKRLPQEKYELVLSTLFISYFTLQCAQRNKFQE